MSEKQCNTCTLSQSIYGQFCSECQNCGLLPSKEDTPQKIDGLLHPKKRKKKKILSTLDILISVFIVTPLVVACWRGTWQLMDIYSDYFPPLESFIVGTLIHIVIGISQESFNGLVNKPHKGWICKFLAFLFMKLYTMAFNAVTNMHWRGGWMIVDEYFGVKHTESGHTEIANPTGAFCFYAILFLIMFAMRCLRNLNSPPFEISLDYGDDMFLFPNMFKVKATDFGLYKDIANQKKSLSSFIYGLIGVGFLCILFLLTLFVAVSTHLQIRDLDSKLHLNQAARAEKIAGLDDHTLIWQENPRPFKTKIHDYTPRGFAMPSTTESSLINKAFLHINPYRDVRSPKNIQEIIDVMSETSLNYIQQNSVGEDNERYHDFRPFHPGEINLMGLSGFRFAPSTWKMYSSKYYQSFKAQQFSPKENNFSIPMIHFPVEQPFLVTLNVHPIKQMQIQSKHFLPTSSSFANIKNEEKYTVLVKVVLEPKINSS